MGENESGYRVFLRKPEGKKPLGSRRGEVNIKIILKEMVWVDVINLSFGKDKWQAVVNTVMNLRIS